MDIIILSLLAMLMVMVSIYAIIDNYFRTKQRYEAMEREKSIWEHCVYCGQRVYITKTTPVDQRLCYIEGAGQLCSDCYDETYNTDKHSISKNIVY